MTSSTFWKTIAESKYSWERDALDFVRQQFPDREPYRAWTNFEFISDDGSINEVDLLVFTTQGFFLVEIKSRPGRLFGDAGTWTWETDGKLLTVDSPLILANTKAKKLRSLLERQPAFKKKGTLPYVEPLVFCSAPDLHCDLQGNGLFRVCLRDKDKVAVGEKPARSGILAAIMRRECPGLDVTPRGTHDRPMAKVLSQAMEQAGIRPSQRHRKVSDYTLDHLVGDGPGYQDWQATHVQVAESKRRIRLYLVRTGESAEARKTNERAALREFQLLETLQHPGILKAYGYTEHEVGPALIFEHDPLSIRLDHFLAQRKKSLGVDLQLDLIRQIAEVIRYAHDKKIVHRALSPQSILITNANSDRPRVKVFNWQVGYRRATSSSGASQGVTATSHVDRLVDDVSSAYMAPEAFSGESEGEHLDLFSLGAIAYQIFSGEAPAANGLELSNKLRETKGLQISSVLNGAGEALQYLIQYSTHPEVSQRADSVADFLSELDDVENELTSPDDEYVDDPTRAQMGDQLPGGYRVIRRLGEGSSSIAFLVERGGQDFVMKVANSPENNSRLKDEADVLRKPEMRHAGLVDFVESLEIGPFAAFLMRPVFADKDKKTVETLGLRVRREGRLHIDLLQRFGADLLGVVNYLEEQGIPHRDIKPDNIAVGMVGRGSKLHLVLFDFSLSRSPAENIRAGTTGYLDPLLPLRKPVRWDLHAERYAAAVTLFELTTGGLPRWGDGTTDPSHLSPTTEITIDPEVFDADLREPLSDFFKKAFRRQITERFDNAEEMLVSWRQCFEGIDEPGPLSDNADESLLAQSLAEATFDSTIAELTLGTRATNALDRANILTVEDLLTIPMRRLMRMRGVGNKTRREIIAAVKTLRARLGNPAGDKAAPVEEAESASETLDVSTLSVDTLAARLLRTGSREGESTQRAIQLLLGLDPEQVDHWPSQSEVARIIDVTRARIGQVVGKLQERWAKDSAVTRLRADLAEILGGQGGVMSVGELVEAILVARGSSQDEPQRSRQSRAIIRAAVEVERTMTDPRFLVRRDDDRVLIALNAELAGYAHDLGTVADQLADEDPLVSPQRVMERLREVPAPSEVSLSDARLIRLAAVVSRHAAVSGRQELYPVGMEALRSLKLAQQAVFTTPRKRDGRIVLTVEQIRERVLSRYPQSAPQPDRPQLDDFLKQAGLQDFDWNHTANEGQGGYVTVLRTEVTSASEPTRRQPTASGQGDAGHVTPEEADARQFEERLQRAIQEGSFLSLLVSPRDYDLAREALRRFPLQLVDFEELFFDSLRDVATKANVSWDLVLKTDATPHQGDWDKLMLLVGRAMPAIEQKLLAAEQTMLLIHPGLLARYEQMGLLSRLSQKVGRRDGIPGLWLLLPNEHQALLDGQAVPLIGPGQKARIPESWLQNVHRSKPPAAAVG